MVQFQCSVPWHIIKNPDLDFFKWLKLNQVFLNRTKFKTDTLFPSGFLLGAHPGSFHHDDAEADLTPNVSPLDDPIDFQLSSRSVSVASSPQKGAPRFSFQAVVVESLANQAAKVRERFFSLNPQVLHATHLYTHLYPLIPFLPSKDWTVEKIHSLARLHVTMLHNQRLVFLHNLQDIKIQFTYQEQAFSKLFSRYSELHQLMNRILLQTLSSFPCTILENNILRYY